ncbi:MAG: fumarate reductase/succinate dehydrogenase flavoprotein subunit [Anaerolineaceae bacterium]|nr:fumarate reductase/succinate dehydrogenase flavoprotein subunit [Anaerolineaceae bacterium]
MSEIQTFDHDVVVIGAGGAGLRAAIECSAQGLNTGMICKSLLGKAHTVMAEGGAAASLGHTDERDNWKVHFRDTMRGGKFLNQWRMAELHAQHAADRIRELEEWGAVFDRTSDGYINQRPFGGHRYPRLAHTGDRTGLEIIRTLQDYGIHQGIHVHQECTALKLLKDSGKISGVFGYWRDTGRFVLFRTKAVIMATGGAGKIWRVTSNSWEYTGDGMEMAYSAGAELIDMEFAQFHPTGMIWPLSVRGILVTEGVRGEGGILLNSNNERFMFNYTPDRFKEETADSPEEAQRWLDGDASARRPPELLTRDVVAKSIMKEVEAGRGSAHGGAYLDIASRRDGEYIKRKLPSMYHQFKELAEVNITNERMEVGPTLHYMMGGIAVDGDTQMTAVPGLFACGECTGGMHGANRLGGNSLSDLLVFGWLAGKGAKDYVSQLSRPLQIDPEHVEEARREAVGPLNQEGGENPYLLHEELQNIMNDVNIVRTAAGLQRAIESLQELKPKLANIYAAGSSQYNPGWNQALSMRPMFVVAEAVARAALIREESRGAHTRLDFEGEREEWGNINIMICQNADGSMDTRKVDRNAPPDHLAEIAYSNLEDLEGGVHV